MNLKKFLTNQQLCTGSNFPKTTWKMKFFDREVAPMEIASFLDSTLFCKHILYIFCIFVIKKLSILFLFVLSVMIYLVKVVESISPRFLKFSVME